jgi:hypothetical protein
MTVEYTVPCASQRFVITCYNVGTNGAIEAGDAVKIVTGATAGVHPKVGLAGATAGTITLAFGVALEAMATGASGPVVTLGPAKVVANNAITVGAAVQLTYGTAALRGRVSLLSAGTAGVTASSKCLGRALTAAATSGTCVVFVNPNPLANA